MWPVWSSSELHSVPAPDDLVPSPSGDTCRLLTSLLLPPFPLALRVLGIPASSRDPDATARPRAAGSQAGRQSWAPNRTAAFFRRLNCDQSPFLELQWGPLAWWRNTRSALSQSDLAPLRSLEVEESLLDLKCSMLKPSSILQPRQPPGELFKAFQATGALRRLIPVTPFGVGD